MNNSNGESKSSSLPTKTILRSKSAPVDNNEFLDKLQLCFKGDGREEITFILTHSNRFFDGFHLGLLIKDITTGVTTTLGFYPKDFGAMSVIKSIFVAQDGAIYIPDPFVEMAIKNYIEKTILNENPLFLSKSASRKINKYICNNNNSSKIKVDISGRSSKSSGEFILTKRFLTNKKFSLSFGNNSSTNCQGLISEIFAEDNDVIEIISPYLYKFCHPSIRKNAQSVGKKIEEEERNKQWGRYSDGTSWTPASMGIVRGFKTGGKKKNRRKIKMYKNKQKSLRKNRKGRTSRKSRKSKKSRKSRKNRKSRKTT